MTPYIVHTKNKADLYGTMEAGHIFRIEPLVTEGSPELDVWDDKWTTVTKDGNRASSFKHTILITKDGFEVLTARFKDSPELEYFA